MTERRDFLRFTALGGLAGAFSANAEKEPERTNVAYSSSYGSEANGINKTRIMNPDKDPDGSPNAIKLSNVREWLIFAGHAAIGANGEILHSGDALAQLRWIYGSLKRTLEQEGYSLADVVQIKMTCVSDIALKDRVQFLTIAREVFGHLDLPPVAATMSVVHALAYPGMLCEVDMWAAR